MPDIPEVEIVFPLDESREIAVVPMLYSKWRLYVREPGSLVYDDGW